MKMKETLKFLKFGLIGVASVTAISTLAISCNEKKNENANNNNDSTQKPGDTNNQGQIQQTLGAAKNAFTLTPITGKPVTNVLASTITTTNLKEYFVETPGADFGTNKGFTYTCTSVKENTDSTKLDVVYEISYKNTKETKEITLTGFRDKNQIDYDLKNPNDFFKIALDKKHLETIVFYAQEYDHYTSLEQHFNSWTLTEDPTRYEATKTNKYFMMGGSKYSIYEIKFADIEGKEPISADIKGDAFQGTPFNILFTPQGKKRNPYLYAVKEGSSNPAKPAKPAKN